MNNKKVKKLKRLLRSQAKELQNALMVEVREIGPEKKIYKLINPFKGSLRKLKKVYSKISNDKKGVV